jgi:hypothetical protein
MSVSYRSDAMLAEASALRPGEIDRANEVLDRAGLGRPLGSPGSTLADLVEVPLTDADPVAVRDALRAARRAGEDVVVLDHARRYVVDTIEDSAQDRVLKASGRKFGHGVVAWLPVPPDRLPPAPPWQPGGAPPVVALLDSGVRDHVWLPHQGTPFCVDAATVPVLQPDLLPEQDGSPLMDSDGRENYRSHWGHATFIAGLIRLAAPHAQVLSLKVMSDDGIVEEARLIAALRSLARYLDDGGKVDVVLMALGRPKEPDDDVAGPFGKLREAVHALGERHVKIVASAGNNGGTAPTVPACFADEPDSAVVSVGAGCSAAGPAWYSNRGAWVKAWRPGSDVLSIMPLRPDTEGPGDDCAAWQGTRFATARAEDGDGAARWSGSSFAAATLAGELAEAVYPTSAGHAGP